MKLSQSQLIADKSPSLLCIFEEVISKIVHQKHTMVADAILPTQQACIVV